VIVCQLDEDGSVRVVQVVPLVLDAAVVVVLIATNTPEPKAIDFQLALVDIVPPVQVVPFELVAVRVVEAPAIATKVDAP
jgi:hypothetical protein